MSVASRLAEAGHYASAQIKQISAQLDQDWKSFAAALDERSTILAMSSVFHQKAEQVRTREKLEILNSQRFITEQSSAPELTAARTNRPCLLEKNKSPLLP